MACVAPHGVLFRGNAEGVIRRFLIEKKNYVDAIIGLPANIFYGTSIPTCILVFKKCRKEDDNILFIDASKEFEKVKTQNQLREQHIQKIVETYRDRKEIEKYSHLASLQEIAENDYNLNIPRYVDTFEEEEPIDIKAVMAEIKELEAKRAELDKEIEVYLKELGLVEQFRKVIAMGENDNIPQMTPSFENICRKDENGNEYWSSRDLCGAMGYSAYW